jgi:hypothetical protein
MMEALITLIYLALALAWAGAGWQLGIEMVDYERTTQSLRMPRKRPSFWSEKLRYPEWFIRLVCLFLAPFVIGLLFMIRMFEEDRSNGQ